MSFSTTYDLFSDACFINGEWLPRGDEGSIAVSNPATDEVIANIPSLSQKQVDTAVAAAQAAFEHWRVVPAKDRGRFLSRLAAAMRDAKDELADIMVAEQGKPITEAKGEVGYAANYLQWFAEECTRAYGDVIPSPAAGQIITVIKEPVGVCACITPWNFPLAMLARKMAAALAAGCTVVAKPSSITPLSALALAKLTQKIALPDGVFNIVTGSAKAIGHQLSEDARIKKLSFTGSTEVGKTLAAQCAPSLKKLSLELGGNAPFIVIEDANLDDAVDGLIAAKFRNNGQTCVCVNRLFVQQNVYNEFIEKCYLAMQKLKVGDARSTQTQQSVLINDDAVTKFNQHVNDALNHGGELLMGGEADSRVSKPTLIKNGKHTMLHCREETFGPLLVAIPFAAEQEVLELANDTPYGLAAYFYAQDNSRIHRVNNALQAGMIGVNETAISNVAAPFGGVKESGFGREGSKYGLDDYTHIKSILTGYKT